ncbi:MAG: VanW family protein [Butyricicoccus sp.]|nr:VanW family protein [Butyricicoccus sp.]
MVTKKKNTKKRPAIIAAAIITVIVLAVIGVCGAAAVYTFSTDTIFPGVSVAGVDLGGMTRIEAANALAEHEAEINAGTISLDINGEIYEIDAADVTKGIDVNDTAQAAYTYGHGSNPLNNIKEALHAKFNGAEIEFAISVDQDVLESRLDEIANTALTVPIQPSYEVVESNLVIMNGEPGVDFDREVLEREVVSRIALMDYSPISVEIEKMDPDPIDLDAIKLAIECEPAPATVDKNDGVTVLGGVTGIKMDLEAAKKIVGDGKDPVYTIPLEVTEPAVTAEKLQELLFRDTLASTSTSLNSGNRPRTSNVRLACSFINGTILNPGEEFSYNGTVGQRTAARGFQSAGAYLNGRVVDEVGGGVCQPSSTLYMAVLRADLEVTERRNHSFTVSYTPLGEDATVSWGTQDFKFRNNTDYPIKIYAEQSGGQMSVKIVGTNIDGKSVKTSREILQTKPYQTVYKDDATLEAGTTKVDQSGSTGYKVVTYKTITVNGQSTTVVANNSNYSARNETILLGPGVTVDAEGNIIKPADPVVDPVVPGVVVDPTDPGAVIDPVVPSEPADPAEPTAPVDPAVPCDPADAVIQIPSADPES